MLISVLEILNKTEEFFKNKKIPNPRLDAQLLLCDVLNCKRLDLFLMFDKAMSENEISKYREYVKRRAKREPLQHILEIVEFYNLKLKTTKSALIPRSETEYLCELICDRFYSDKKEDSLNILDLGTGTGAIALSLANNFKNSKVQAVDKSSEALNLAKENARINDIKNIDFIESDWFENIDDKYDIIVSNPPYLNQNEYDTAQDEVKIYEPKSALISDNDGFADLEIIIKSSKEFLKENGTLFLETGIAHSKYIKELSEKLNFSSCEFLNDLNEYERFAILKI